MYVRNLIARPAAIMFVLLVTALVAGCSDDASPKGDARADVTAGDGPASDGLAGDGSVGDGPVTDTSGDGAAGTASLTINVSLDRNITCGNAAANDCKGLLLVAVIDQKSTVPPAKILGEYRRASSDLSNNADYETTISGLPVGVTVYVSGMLAEDGTISNPPFPQTDDIVIEPQAITLSAGNQKTKIELDSRFSL